MNTATHEPTPVARDPCHVLDRSVDSPTFRPDRAALLPLPSGTFRSLLVRSLALVVTIASRNNDHYSGLDHVGRVITNGQGY